MWFIIFSVLRSCETDIGVIPPYLVALPQSFHHCLSVDRKLNLEGLIRLEKQTYFNLCAVIFWNLNCRIQIINECFCLLFHSWMYWTDWEEDEIDDSVGRIEKAWMNGHSRQIFVTSKMLWPNGLTLDYRSNLLYWCDAYYDHIERIFLNGTDRKVKEYALLCCSQTFLSSNYIAILNYVWKFI